MTALQMLLYTCLKSALHLQQRSVQRQLQCYLSLLQEQQKQGFQRARGLSQRYSWSCGGSSQYWNSQESSWAAERTTNRSKQHFQIRSSSSKEMTSLRTIPCTSLFTCAKPINMCSIYTGGNTSARGMHKSISCMQRWGSVPVTPTTITSCMFRCDSTPATTISQYEH